MRDLDRDESGIHWSDRITFKETKPVASGSFLREGTGGFAHWCPGCSTIHFIATHAPYPPEQRWSFDRNFEQPTFAPSIKTTLPLPNKPICHYWIEKGMIRFETDSFHHLKGQTVRLPAMPRAFES